MRIISFLICITITGLSLAQTVNAGYLHPTLGDVNSYKYVRFGTPEDYKAGFLWNFNSPAFGNGDDFSIFTYNNRDISFYTGTGNVVVFPSGGGDMGIGTVSPEGKLDVNGKTIVNSLRIDSNNPTSSVNGFLNRMEFTTGGNAAIVFHPGSTDELMFGMHSNGNFYWGTGGVNAITPNYYSMYLNGNNGDLGIKGKLTSNEVKVKLGGWSDFVFAKDYELPTLKEVEQHIQEKGHLKDIPSAKEVEENGILLGDMNAKLLQKIEELTLYVLSLKKENEKQNEQLIEQAKNIQELKSITNHYDENKQD